MRGGPALLGGISLLTSEMICRLGALHIFHINALNEGGGLLLGGLTEATRSAAITANANTFLRLFC